MIEQVESVLGDDAAAQIQTMVQQLDDFGGGALATVLSLLALAFGATGAFHQLQGSLNKAWAVAPDPDRSGVKVFALKRLVSFILILGIALLILATLFVSTILTRAGGEVAQLLPDALTGPLLVALDIGLSLVIYTLLFGAIFKVLPDAQIRWRSVVVGALVTAVLFVILKYTFGIFLSLSDPGSAYGAAGSLAVLLLWIYVSSIVLLLGAEFTQVWARWRGHRIEPSEGAVRVVKRTLERAGR
jgi:membrane protein